MVEILHPFNPRVVGSSPTGPTCTPGPSSAWSRSRSTSACWKPGRGGDPTPTPLWPRPATRSPFPSPGCATSPVARTPAVLSAHGPTVALESLTARATVPVHLTVELEGRVAESVEVAAYFVVSESLAKVCVHARVPRRQQ